MQSDKSTQQNRNMGLLVAAQSLGGASPPIIISLGGLVGQMLSSTPTAATLPVSLYQLGRCPWPGSSSAWGGAWPMCWAR